MEYSHFQSGDHLLSINKQVIDPREMTPDEARSYMNDCLTKDGVLNVVTENPNGDDILINVTVIKPRRSMNYEDLGLIVWNWPYLCVRQINEGSIFEHTPVQETDQIVAINDIDCSKMRTRAFATCVEELPTELTITLIRRKHRYTGSFK
jgi:type II secretory pathway component PulC